MAATLVLCQTTMALLSTISFEMTKGMNYFVQQIDHRRFSVIIIPIVTTDTQHTLGIPPIPGIPYW